MSTKKATRALALLATLLAAPTVGQSQSPKELTAASWREDLSYLMQQIEKRHAKMYHTHSRAFFDSAKASLDARIPSLARHEIIAEMMKIVALVGDGHTNIYPSRDTVIAFHSLPVSFYRFKDGWFVRSASSAFADLVGARVVAIEGTPIEKAYDRIKEYVGRDNEMGSRFWAAYLFTMPEMLHASRLAASVDSAAFEIEKGGRRKTVWLKPLERVRMTPADTDMSWSRREGWIDARGQSDPLWLRQRPDSVFWWFEKLPGTSVGYAQINQVRNNAKAGSLEKFSLRLMQFADTANLDKLIIDLRLNRGGNGYLIKPLERELLRRPHLNARGKLYILMGRSTWSAAQFFLNDMQEFSNAIFIGEPSGSKGNAYGDSRQIKLPNSGITARASIYYWQDWHPEDARQWVAPEIASEMTFADYVANRDPALDAALKDRARPSLVDELVALIQRGDTVGAHSRFAEYRRDPVRSYMDLHVLLDNVALHFYNDNDIPRATVAFVMAARAFPTVLRAHLNTAAMYQSSGKTELEIASLSRALEIDPSHAGAGARLKALLDGGKRQ